MKIPILHLADGVHQFAETIKGGSLHFYRGESFPNDLQVEIELNKFDKNISCHLHVETQALYRCDRCLEEFDRKVKVESEILFHLGEHDLDTDEAEVISLSPEEKEIDLDPLIEELLVLDIPMKCLCKEDCRGICAGCGADLNKEKCSCSKHPTDPRWEKLLDFRK